MLTTPFRRIPPLSERDRSRFWSKVQMASPNECWLWKGYTHSDAGYGLFSLTFDAAPYGHVTGLFGAHRISYEISCGPVPDGQLVLHSCDIKPCVNPAHLRIGTLKDNEADKTARGRHSRGGRTPGVRLPRIFLPARSGERHIFSKLSDETVRIMRERYFGDEAMTAKALAREHGISIQNVIAILTGRSRKAATGPTGTIRPIRGSRVPNALLTEEVVMQMRTEWADGMGTIHDLGKKYGVAFQTVSKIIRGITWRHVGGLDLVLEACRLRPRIQRLTHEQVELILRDHAASIPGKQIAATHGVSPALVSLIVNRKLHFRK